MNRREACLRFAAGLGTALFLDSIIAETSAPFKLNYALATSLFGVSPLEEILAVTKKTGADRIDLWPKVHGNQREQVDEMGEEKFVELLTKYGLKLGLTTRFDLGPFALADEMSFVSRLGGKLIVTGPKGRKNLQGEELKKEIAGFLEQLKPQVELAEKNGIVLAIENHGNMLLDSPDAVRYFADGIQSPALGIAFAPYHLPQDPALLASLIEHCGSKLSLFYAWQHGKGAMSKLPKEQELEQLPGRGGLDFKPILAALRKIGFQGPTEIFMHPFPRGIAILETVEASAEELDRSRRYLESCG